MRNFILLFIVAIGFSAASIAQSSPVTVYNNTNCAYLVTLTAAEDGCGQTCNSITVCVPPGPGASATIPTCNTNWFWDHATVTPAYDSCLPCGSASVMVRSPAPTNCLGLGNPAGGAHCAGCGPFTVNFGSLTAIKIY